MIVLKRPLNGTLLLRHILIFLISLRQCRAAATARIDVEGRHSFSLSTFDPSGKLGQVYHATRAASLGPPLVFICRPEQGILMASPQVLPSPLVHDDGTARFARITSQIFVAHSGLSADGRLLIAAAQRMSVEHEFTYDEPIPIDLLLEEISLLFQEYTMKPATRPFGVTLVVAYLPESKTLEPQLYRIDPSGSVESLGQAGVVNGDKMQSDDKLLAKLKEIAESPKKTSLEEDRTAITKTLEEALQQASGDISSKDDTSTQSTEDVKKAVLPNNIRRILSASLTYKEGMIMDRHDLPTTPLST